MLLRIIKKIIPRGLFARSLLIIVLPVAILQAMMVYLFYQRHWESVTRRMAESLAGDLAVMAVEMEMPGSLVRKKAYLKSYETYLDMRASILPKRAFAKNTKLSEEYKYFLKALQAKIEHPFSVSEGEEYFTVHIALNNSLLAVEVSRKRLTSPTTYIFVLWMISGSIVVMTVAVLFLKNQIRPIVNLAEFSEKFGRGLDMPKFKPTGAKEVRKAAVAFLVMSKRIRRQISQRTEMLAAISHDLRSPITRMKLQLAMLPEGRETQYLSEDVTQMEKMVESYLRFAKGEGAEDVAAISLTDLTQEIESNFTRQNRKLFISAVPDIVFEGRRGELLRALSNLIENAFFYGSKVRLLFDADETHLHAAVEDDGPGIPEDKQKEVFGAFYRLDKARTPNNGGVGLGLTIARDIILAHGGNIRLSRAKIGGLRVEVKLPV